MLPRLRGDPPPVPAKGRKEKPHRPGSASACSAEHHLNNLPCSGNQWSQGLGEGRWFIHGASPVFLSRSEFIEVGISCGQPPLTVLSLSGGELHQLAMIFVI